MKKKPRLESWQLKEGSSGMLQDIPVYFYTVPMATSFIALFSAEIYTDKEVNSLELARISYRTDLT